MFQFTFDTNTPASILVVDDAPDNLTLLKQVLSQDGYEVRVAPNGRLALRSVQANPPDLLLLDIRMPDLDGFAVCRVLKADEHTRNIPIIFLTGLSSSEDEENGLELGAVDYIIKPISPPLVRARVRTHLHVARHHKLLERWALLDGLTEIPNRRRFENALEHEWQRCLHTGTPLSLVMLDLDWFKQYNDQLGHCAGDQALCKVAACLSAGVKRAGDIVARYGGEEFVLLLPDTAAAAASSLAEQLRLSVTALNLPHPSTHLPLSISLGGATAIPHASGQAVKLLECADRALYQSKAQGRNCVAWQADMEGLISALKNDCTTD